MTTAICSTKGINDGPSAYWRQRLAVQHSNSLPKTQAYTLGTQRRGAMVYLIKDTHLMSDGSDWWTDDPADAQVYYSQEVAFGKAGILSSLIDAPVEVVALDG